MLAIGALVVVRIVVRMVVRIDGLPQSHEGGGTPFSDDKRTETTVESGSPERAGL